MSLKKPYVFHLCKECNIDFLVKKGWVGKVNCPKCADSFFVEKIKDIWIERPNNYKRPYTDLEDQIILDGKNAGYLSAKIAEGLEGRTPKAINRRYQQLMKRGIYQ